MLGIWYPQIAGYMKVTSKDGEIRRSSACTHRCIPQLHLITHHFGLVNEKGMYTVYEYLHLDM